MRYLSSHTLVRKLIKQCLLCSLSLALPLLTLAESVLQVLPTRVVMDGPKRSANITLINRGDEEGSYRMFFRNIRTNDQGEFSEAKQALEGELFANNMLRFSPRRITVPARSKQSIRVVLRKPKDMPAGEYRSHLVFRKLPKQSSALDDEASNQALGFSLKPIVEVTIPVIVRSGKTMAKLSLSEATIRANASKGRDIHFTINRQGNRSLYGDVGIWWLKADGSRESVGLARGIAVYSPNDKREFEMPLELNQQQLDNGKLLIEYIEDPAFGGNLKTSLEVPI